MIDPELQTKARDALFRLYQQAQKWGIPDRYHFGIRAREVSRG